MIRECDICGKQEWEKYMEHYSTGRKTVWLCWECYLNAQREASLADFNSKKRCNKKNSMKQMNK